MKVLVDADACPRGALAIVRRLQCEYAYSVLTISSVNHRFDEPEHVTVGGESQAADIALINRVHPGDVVVTQDWGLAVMVLGKGGWALDPNGRVYREETIGFMMEERHLKAKFRRSGGRTRGPKARTRTNDQDFESALRELVKEALS